ncbi:MAG: formyl-CoA transferase [Thiotrichales bacterium]|nr:formyl-CoA transferase [Thiotrichales bacterium]
MAGVLDGIKVVDFGRYIAGPFCAALLGDLGADVIRVERIEGAEDRAIAPVGGPLAGAIYLQCNRNKRGITLNPTTEDGRVITDRLIATADVVVANYPARALKSLGLDYARLSAVKPEVILATVNAFGDGPWADKIGFDGLAQAMSGNLFLSGEAGVPTRSFTAYVDFATASLSALSVLAALMHRHQTGRGQLVEGALLKTALTFMNPAILEQQQLGNDRQATLNQHPYSGPSDVFATRDGWIMCMVLGDYQFKRWCELVDAPELLTDPRFQDDQLRGDNGGLLSERMAAWCETQTTDSALKALESARVPAGPVYSPRQALDDEHIKQLDFYNMQDHPELSTPALIPGYPVSFSEMEVTATRRAPILGEHTDEVLKELGFNATEIAQFREHNVI